MWIEYEGRIVNTTNVFAFTFQPDTNSDQIRAYDSGSREWVPLGPATPERVEALRRVIATSSKPVVSLDDSNPQPFTHTPTKEIQIQQLLHDGQLDPTLIAVQLNTSTQYVASVVKRMGGKMRGGKIVIAPASEKVYYGQD